MKIRCYAFSNVDNELEVPFLEYLEKNFLPREESEKTREKRVKHIINVREHIKHLAVKKGIYNSPPLVKAYKCPKVGDITEIGILKIKEGKILISVGFITFTDRDEIVIFDAFDKPVMYEKAKKRKIEKIEDEFVESIRNQIEDYLKNGYALPVPGLE